MMMSFNKVMDEQNSPYYKDSSFLFEVQKLYNKITTPLSQLSSFIWLGLRQFQYFIEI